LLEIDVSAIFEFPDKLVVGSKYFFYTAFSNRFYTSHSRRLSDCAWALLHVNALLFQRTQHTLETRFFPNFIFLQINSQFEESYLVYATHTNFFFIGDVLVRGKS